MPEVVLSRARFDAVIFDLDGVVTDTASLHAAAWKRLFDEYLRGRVGRSDELFLPFDIEHDYRRYVDGRPRYDGVVSFLSSRGITLPPGEPGDDEHRETVCGLGNRKDRYFHQQLATRGVVIFDSTLLLVDALHHVGFHVAVISASRNCREILESAGLIDRFDERVDGETAAALELPGKPDPAVFLEAARRLRAEPSRTVVVEDALAGVEAGARGGFGLVIGVNRADADHAQALRDYGAHVVVSDLAKVGVEGDSAHG